jgi:hypothetical protein
MAQGEAHTNSTAAKAQAPHISLDACEGVRLNPLAAADRTLGAESAEKWAPKAQPSHMASTCQVTDSAAVQPKALHHWAMGSKLPIIKPVGASSR